jgi:dipeptidyl aminopeptidase/acylaminoacyl peptidase
MAAKRLFSIDDLWSLARVGAPSVSPDGAWACVAVTRYDMQSNEARSNLWLLSTDGRVQRQLTRGKHDAEPAFSPDGRQIAFVSRRKDDGESGTDKPESSQLYVIDVDGGEARRITHLETGVSGIRWFPDGKRLAFISWVWPGLDGEDAQNKQSRKERKDKVQAFVIDNNHYRYWDHWRPRGREAHLWVVDAKGGKAHDLFSGTRHFLPPEDPDASMYDIAPDGRHVAFTEQRERDPGAPAFCDIQLLEIKTKKSRNLTAGQAPSHEYPAFAPDGSTLACLASDYLRAHNQQARLALITVKNAAVRPITDAWDFGVNAPVRFSADSEQIYFSAEKGEIQPLFRVAARGGTPEEVCRGKGHGGTTGPMQISADGLTLVYLRAAIAYPPSLFACAANGENERAIERFNDPILAKIRLASSESVTLKGFAGEPVQMWIIKPPGFDKKRKWPLMQVIHGGPHTCFGDAWHWRWNAQLFAAAGYVVAEVNYHGSTGWGQDFISSINGDWGRRELADVEAGTDYMIKTGYIDAKRVVATGGSYGGYMVAYMNGNVKNGRYQAYVCHAGCYDWVAMMGSDGYYWFGQELGAFPWQDEARVLAQSPHHYAASFATPTLVIHGELDYRVPYYQGLAYYNTLRVLGVDTRMVFFPDENHWILKPQNSRLWYREFLAWCDKYSRPRGKTAAPARRGNPQK